MSLVERLWWRDDAGLAGAALAAPLLVGEALFRAGAAVRGAAYGHGLLRSTKAGVPVISVGNLAVGGAGKTPVTLELARRLGERGRRVAILSRGYGAARTDARIVSDGVRVLLGAEDGGDEPVLLARRAPGAAVLCGPRRAELAALATSRLGADALLLDDGFQHRALARDLDVVVLDAANPFGNGHLLPRGPNREPRAALRRAGLVWLSRADQADAAALDRLRALARDATGRAPVESRHAPSEVLDGALARSVGLDALRGARVALLSGLARPDAFRRTVEALGAEVALTRAFPDHHRFTDAELDAVLADARAAGCAHVVTTEKDAVRLSPARAADARLRVVRIDVAVTAGEPELERALAAALAAHPGAEPTGAASGTGTP